MIRAGFVSNSSSSSFVVWGVTMPPIDDEIVEKLEKAHEEDGLNWSCPWDDEDAMVGLPFTSIGLDETGKQFRERAEKAIKKYFPDVKDFCIIDEVIPS